MIKYNNWKPRISPYKTAAIPSPISQVRQTRHTRHHRKRKYELISDILLWTPVKRGASGWRPGKTYFY